MADFLPYFLVVPQRFSSYFDVAGFETTLPQQISFAVKKLLYTYQHPGSDRYPPHLNLIPLKDQVPLTKIFELMRLIDTGSILTLVIPETVLDWYNSNPNQGATVADIQARNKKLRAEKKNIYVDPNIGDHDDWYTDSVMGQQQLTGVNPTNITLATKQWIDDFKSAAKAQKNDKMVKRLEGAAVDSLYMQDCSWYRKALGLKPDSAMVSEDGTRWALASVSLFHLSPEGRLHPLAVVIDWKGSMEKSLCVFNRRLTDSDPKTTEEQDWPWRYAKTCSQIADWIRHEVQIHLVNCHFVEEAGIVAAQRCFPDDHPVFRLLQPHWLKTLSLNAAARSALVPQVVVKLVGMTEEQTYAFIRATYEDFDWKSLYIPNDLNRRGFPENRLYDDPKYHNYAYGKDMILLWRSLKKFVLAILKIDYKSDADITADAHISAWVTAMRSPDGAQMPKFPSLKTVDDLADIIVMLISIAAPQHSSVNYLQEYYQSFVPNKPPALCTPPVTSLAAYAKIDEPTYMRSLPVDRPRQWLLASHLPHLLSFKVTQEQNLVTYAASLAKISAQKGDAVRQDAAKGLWEDLGRMGDIFRENSEMIDEQTCKYEVLQPPQIANSILI